MIDDDLTIPSFLRRKAGEKLPEVKFLHPVYARTAAEYALPTTRGRPLGYMSEEMKALKKARTSARLNKMLVRQASRRRDLTVVRWDGSRGRWVDIVQIKILTQEDMMNLDLDLPRTGSEWVKLWNSMVLTAVDLGINGHEVVHKFTDKGTARKRCAALHGLIQQKNGMAVVASIPIGELHQHPAAVPNRESWDKIPAVKKVVSPGFARLKAHPDAEKIRQTTVKEQKLARKGVSGDAGPKVSDVNRRITVLSKKNPRTGKAGERFAKYRTGMTVAEYIKAIGDRGRAIRDIRWDLTCRFISLA
jgi:hypothetical protein